MDIQRQMVDSIVREAEIIGKGWQNVQEILMSKRFCSKTLYKISKGPITKYLKDWPKNTKNFW